jgi:hypothetical protein
MPDMSSTDLNDVAQPSIYGPESVRASATSSKAATEVLLESPSNRRATTHQVTRLAGRLNASAVSDAERDALLSERARLLDKVVANTISRKEEIRLEYVRWSLDRIEDARHGPAMDRLESQIDEFQRLATRLLGLRGNLDDLSKSRNRR